VAARKGADPATNFSLRLAIERARAANMPKANIEKAIERSQGKLGAQIEEIIYEAYGPSGSAILIEAATDNKNRASAEIKAVLNKFSAKLATANAVQYLFEKRAVIRLESDNPDQTEEAIIDSGAENYAKNGSTFSVFTKAENLISVQENLQKPGQKITSSEIIFEPKTTLNLDEKEAEKTIKLLKALDDLDDVFSVSSNLG